MKPFASILLLLSGLLSCSSPETAVPVSGGSTEFVERSRADINKPTPPGHLCIYYGYPSLVNNGKGDTTAAIKVFAQFNLIVLGDGLWQTSHPDYANTKSIIAGLVVKKRFVFGYIDLGVSTNNYSEAQLRQQIDGWKTLKASGIFFDGAGYDFKVTRDRQNTVIQYCRQVGMRVFMNAWNPDDVLADPNCLLNENDYYLAESYLVGHNAYSALDAWKKKADACYAYMVNKGIKIASVATGGETIAANFNATDKFSLAWCGTSMYNFHYFQATNSLYSANNNVVYLFDNLKNNLGTSFRQNSVQKEGDTHYFRSTDSQTLHIYGNGSTQGNGAVTTP